MSAVTTNLSYDYESRVSGITYPSSATNSFKYNGNDLRVQKIDSSGTRNYITDGDSPAAAVLSDGLATFTPGLSERRSSTSSFYHGDALGSTRSQTSSSQSVTDTKRYDAFGMLVASTGSNPTPFGFVGGSQYQTDADSGLMLLGHRYYDASIGRFISRDPIYAGDNWYAYCENNPLGGTDPSGLERRLYLKGSDSPGNLTPRLGDVGDGVRDGLSTFDRPDKLPNMKPGDKYQIIDIDLLPKELITVTDKDGHVSIRPKSTARLREWALTRGTSTTNELTIGVGNAIIGVGRAPKKPPTDTVGQIGAAILYPVQSATDRYVYHAGQYVWGVSRWIETHIQPIVDQIDPKHACPHGCFDGSTPVLMANGIAMPIREICPGDVVVTYDKRLRRCVPCRVACVSVTLSNELTMITLPSGEIIQSTYRHPVYNADMKAIPANQCRSVVSVRGATMANNLLCHTTSVCIQPRCVYNLEIDNQHNFLVGDSALLVGDMITRLSATQ